MVRRYEYLVIDFMGLLKTARGGVLNGAGQQGWELVSVMGDMAYMKRRIVEVEDKRLSPPHLPQGRQLREGGRVS